MGKANSGIEIGGKRGTTYLPVVAGDGAGGWRQWFLVVDAEHVLVADSRAGGGTLVGASTLQAAIDLPAAVWRADAGVKLGG